jgi:hypothetical protein
MAQRVRRPAEEVMRSNGGSQSRTTSAQARACTGPTLRRRKPTTSLCQTGSPPSTIPSSGQFNSAAAVAVGAHRYAMMKVRASSIKHRPQYQGPANISNETTTGLRRILLQSPSSCATEPVYSDRGARLCSGEAELESRPCRLMRVQRIGGLERNPRQCSVAVKVEERIGAMGLCVRVGRRGALPRTAAALMDR